MWCASGLSSWSCPVHVCYHCCTSDMHLYLQLNQNGRPVFFEYWESLDIVLCNITLTCNLQPTAMSIKEGSQVWIFVWLSSAVCSCLSHFTPSLLSVSKPSSSYQSWVYHYIEKLSTYWIRMSMTLHLDQWENVIRSALLKHMRHAYGYECVCVCVCDLQQPQKQLYCPLQIICNWISLFTPQTKVQLTLITSSYPVDNDCLLLWFKTLCTSNQHAAPLVCSILS